MVQSAIVLYVIVLYVITEYNPKKANQTIAAKHIKSINTVNEQI